MKIAIIGAGASGIFCAANLSNFFDVKIFEAQNAPLKKLLITGGGRCNFTNTNIDKLEPKNFYPRGAGNLRKALRQFSSSVSIDFFESRGVSTKVEEEGRVFPKSDKSQDIANALLKSTNAQIMLNCPIASVRAIDGKFAVKPVADDEEIFDAVIFAVGGKWNASLKKSVEEFGHKFEPEIPSLYGLCADNATDQSWLSGITLKDVLLQADFNGKKIKTSGALLTTHFGITGPAVLKFSSFAAKELFASGFKCSLFVNFLPNENLETISVAFKKARATEAKKLVKNYCPFNLPLAFWSFVLSNAGVAERTTFANLSKADETKIVKLLSEFELRVSGKSSSKGEFVSCGGVDCADVDFNTMQSKKISNLFFLGECLNIDAITGGYNLHAAFTTAHVASQHLLTLSSK